MKPRALTALTAVVLAASLTLSACAQIPTTGKITSQDINVPDPGPVFLSADGPVRDSSPQEIVEGFISAQAAGLSDEWKVAKEFLTDSAATRWQPTGQTTIFAGELDLDEIQQRVPGAPEETTTATGPDTQDPTAHPDETHTPEAPAQTQEEDGTQTVPEPTDLDSDPDIDNPDAEESAAPNELVDPNAATVQGSATVAATLDGAGNYTEALPGAQTKLNFDLVRNADGQWRISTVADGYFISQPNFQSQFRPVAVYFLSADQTFLVPEIRWFWRNRVETYAINSLLAGPSSWLQDAVRTAIPGGTRLVYDSVSVDSFGAAHVNLSSEVLAATGQERKNLVSQIQATLLRLPGVRTVEIQVNSVEFLQDPNGSLVRDPILAASPIVLSDGRLFRLNGRTPQVLDAFGAVDRTDITGLAINDQQDWAVMRLGTATLATFPGPGGEPAVLMKGKGLAAPTIDRFDWAWSGEAEAAGQIRAVQRDGTEVTIAASWLAERAIINMRVAHDGSRVAIISGDGDQSQIEMAAVIRDPSGVPLSLSTPVTVGSALSDASLVQWLDEVTLAVVAHSASSDLETLFTVTVGGRSDMISSVPGAVSIGSGRDLRSLFIGTDTGEILSRTSTGASWATIHENAYLPTFPG